MRGMSLVKTRWLKPGLVAVAVLVVLATALQLTGPLTGWSPFRDRSHPAVRIADAAGKSELRRRAFENTRTMLTGLLRALGFQVTVVENR